MSLLMVWANVKYEKALTYGVLDFRLACCVLKNEYIQGRDRASWWKSGCAHAFFVGKGTNVGSLEYEGVCRGFVVRAEQLTIMVFV
jgi:hypothetical protein